MQDFKFERSSKYPTCFEDFLKNEVQEPILSETCSLFNDLIHPKEGEDFYKIIKNVQGIIKKRKEFEKEFENKKEDIQVYKLEPKKIEVLKINKEFKQIILIFIFYDLTKKKFDIFIPRKGKTKLSDIFSIVFELKNISNKNLIPFIIYDENDKITKDIDCNKKSIQSLIKYSNKNFKLKKNFTDSYDLFNYSINIYTCLEILEKIINLLI